MTPTCHTVVGPLIKFRDGTTVAYDVPRSTLDPRYTACRIHRPACDCREALHAEDINEYRAIINSIRRTTREVLRGHATWAFTADGEWDYARRCPCTGCQISRVEGTRPGSEQEQEGTPTRRPAGWIEPR